MKGLLEDYRLFFITSDSDTESESIAYYLVRQVDYKKISDFMESLESKILDQSIDWDEHYLISTIEGFMSDENIPFERIDDYLARKFKVGFYLPYIENY